MRKIQSPRLAQLLMQLRFTPVSKRKKQLSETIKLLEIIQKDKEYPYEFIYFRITGHQPNSGRVSEIITGEQLFEDLRIFISKLSAQVADRIDTLPEKIYRIDELANTLGVSTKTINRWRRRGLVAEKYIFEDGKKVFGFPQSAVDKFSHANPDLIKKATEFRRLTKIERKKIIKKAMDTAAKTNLSRHRIIEKIAQETGRCRETIRYTLLKQEKAEPDKITFKHRTGTASTEEANEIFKLYKQGTDIKDLIKQFRRSKSSIYRIINIRRAKAILAQRIEYVLSNEFLQDSAEEKILSSPLNYKSEKKLAPSGENLTDYMKILKDTPLLSREQEAELFRRYNFLKYLASTSRTGLKAGSALSARLKKIEGYMAEAEIIKRMIIEANLRLVVGIARKHSREPSIVMDLISEGNYSLMRAIEKYDYIKGFRFSTYASWVIAKDFAHKVPQETTRTEPEREESIKEVIEDKRVAQAADFEAVEYARRSLIEIIKNELDERESYVILSHFGLTGSLVKKEKKTLQQIGEELQLTKERVRQIELVALQKLRQLLSSEEFELLTE